MLHKKHAKGVIKTIKAMISVKLALFTLDALNLPAL